MTKIKKEVMSSKVYTVLKDMIADYRFKPGARVNVEKVSRELGVSRTPVWEAVRRLEQGGLLTNIPNRGVFMVEMTLEMAYELFQVRGALERLVARLAAENMDNRTLEKLSSCVEDQMKVIEKEDLLGYSRLDFEFHSIIYKAGHNVVLQEMLDSVRTKMQPVSMQIMPILPRLYQDHIRILEAMRSKDPDLAEQVFIRHNENVLGQIKKDIEMADKSKRESRQFKDSQFSRRPERG
ncbi:MAG: GntR family transcriptional regulator [Deltaproteobacteria bacterium]